MLDVPGGEMTEAEKVCYDAGWLTPLQAFDLRSALTALVGHSGYAAEGVADDYEFLVAVKAKDYREARAALARCSTPAPSEQSTRTGE